MDTAVSRGRPHSPNVLAQWGLCVSLEIARGTLVMGRVLRRAGEIDYALSMSTRREITKKYAFEYAASSKKVRQRMLDEVVATAD